MTVQLTPHGQRLLEAALSRGVGRSPKEVIERALEAATGTTATLSEEERERRWQAVARMEAFREEYHHPRTRRAHPGPDLRGSQIFTGHARVLAHEAAPEAPAQEGWHPIRHPGRAHIA